MCRATNVACPDQSPVWKEPSFLPWSPRHKYADFRIYHCGGRGTEGKGAPLFSCLLSQSRVHHITLPHLDYTLVQAHQIRCAHIHDRRWPQLPPDTEAAKEWGGPEMHDMPQTTATCLAPCCRTGGRACEAPHGGLLSVSAWPALAPEDLLPRQSRCCCEGTVQIWPTSTRS